MKKIVIAFLILFPALCFSQTQAAVKMKYYDSVSAPVRDSLIKYDSIKTLDATMRWIYFYGKFDLLADSVIKYTTIRLSELEKDILNTNGLVEVHDVLLRLSFSRRRKSQ